jgi:outer membrane protein OmpU
MKNILKTIAVLVSASLISVVAKAGDLNITGSAKASYVINSKTHTGKAFGVSNELNFSASGELDNGYTWNYHTELDPADGGTATNDDSALVVGLGDLGTVGIYDSEGGLSTETSWGIGAMGAGSDYGNTMTRIGIGSDVSAEQHIEYHTPSGLLPLGIAISAGYAPNTADGQSNSYKNAGVVASSAIVGTTASQYRVSMAPIDGLKLGADYFETGGQKPITVKQEQTAGTMYAQYAFGNFKIGTYAGFLEPAKTTDKHATAAADTATASNGDQYEFDGIGVEFAVNDALSLSYSVEDFERKDYTFAATATSKATTSVTAEQATYMVAYNIGGATVGVSMVDTDNSDYITGNDEKKTIFSLAMEF